MLRRSLVFVHVVSCIALALGGCGGDKESSKAGSDNSKTPTAKPTAKPAVKQAPKLSADAPPSERTKAFFAAMKAGEALANDDKHAEAVKKYDEALVAAPGDPLALVAISRSAMKSGDLARAESAARYAMARAWRPQIKANAMYRLGRVLEEKKDKAGATTVYSLAYYTVMPDYEVKERLKALGLKVTPPAEKWPNVRPLEEAKAPTPYADGKPFATKLAKAAPPFEDAYVAKGKDGCDLTLKVAGKHYVLPRIQQCRTNSEYTHTTIELKAIKHGKANVLEINMMQRGADYQLNEQGAKVWTTEEQYSVIHCGVGKSKAPACTIPLGTKRSYLWKKNADSKPRISGVNTLELNQGKDKSGYELKVGAMTMSNSLEFP